MMTLEQLDQHHTQIHQVLAHEIQARQQRGAGDTITLAQLEAAMDSLNALRSELAPLLAGKPKEPMQRHMLVDTRVEYIIGEG